MAAGSQSEASAAHAAAEQPPPKKPRARDSEYEIEACKRTMQKNPSTREAKVWGNLTGKTKKDDGATAHGI